MTASGSTVGRMIRQRRIALGLTQRQAADLAGVSVGSWRSTESGTRRPRPHTFAAILTAVGLTARDVHQAAVPVDAQDVRRELVRLVSEELPADLAPVLLRVTRLMIAGHGADASDVPLDALEDEQDPSRPV